MFDLDAVLRQIDGNLQASLGRLCELLRFESVGTRPDCAAACRACAEWLKAELAGFGFAAELRETTGHPAVVAILAPPDLPSHAPHVLFYGHYDVQPVDPLELWESPPFEPQIRTGDDGEARIYARGASDDKGQLMTFLEASRAWLSVHGRLPCRLTVVIEGDEEGDNSHFDRFIEENREELAADVAFVCDTGLWDRSTPKIVTRLRGCIAEEITVRGPSKDLHSGYYGGAARNPIHVLARILGEMHDGEGRVTIPGFYDGVEAVPDETLRQWRGLGFPEAEFLREVGLSVPAGERGYAVYEQIWSRPTAEFNGIWGGYTGAGRKTVLPATASAKLTFRLVGRQDPAKIRTALRRFVADRLPPDCSVAFDSSGGDNFAVTVPEASRWITLARRALGEEWGRDPVIAADGGSIPVVSTFQRVLGIPTLLAGFARDDDAFHSPNEKYDVQCFHKGMRSWARILAGLAAEKRHE
jgi:acetylornithine deacetylase/succinyl-diaminopimelate desuccinylase-like protein